MIEARARAKVNLALGVLGRRADGYHDLVSVFARLDLADRLAVEPRSGEAEDRVEATGGSIEYQAGPDDLVLRAIDIVRTALAPGAPGLRIRLEKHVPLAAGLGGGSADGAAAIELAVRSWALDLSPEARLTLAVRLGSDVPFLAADADAALVTGRGEHVAALPGPRRPVGILLVTVGAGLATRDVFVAFDALAPTTNAGERMPTAADHARSLAKRLAIGMTAAELADSAEVLRDANDLWPAAVRLRPDLSTVRERLEVRLARPLLLSGSGPTLVALYPSRADAETAATALRKDPVPGVEPSAVRAATFERTTDGEAP